MELVENSIGTDIPILVQQICMGRIEKFNKIHDTQNEKMAIWETVTYLREIQRKQWC